MDPHAQCEQGRPVKLGIAAPASRGRTSLAIAPIAIIEAHRIIRPAPH
jgi:hypothetical protein